MLLDVFSQGVDLPSHGYRKHDSRQQRGSGRIFAEESVGGQGQDQRNSE